MNENYPIPSPGILNLISKPIVNKLLNLEYVERRKYFERLFYSESSGAKRLTKEEKEKCFFLPNSLKEVEVLNLKGSKYKFFNNEDIERYLRYLESFDETKVWFFKKDIRNDKLNLISRLIISKSEDEFLKDLNLNILSDILKKHKVDIWSLLKKYFYGKWLKFKFYFFTKIYNIKKLLKFN